MPSASCLLVLGSLLTLVGCKGRSSPPASDAGADAGVAADAGGTADAAVTTALDGEKLFQSLCAVCHGADARGYKADNAPSLVNPTFLESAPDEQIRRSIVEGRPGTSMAAYGAELGGPLGADKVAGLVAWIRSHGPPAKAIPARGVGDATRGAPIYAANCERCHGSADKRSTAVHLANPRFLDAASDAFIGWAIHEGRPGTPMESWQGKLSDAQIDDVVAYVRAFAKPAAPTMLPAPTGTEPLLINPAGKPPSFTPRSSPCPTNGPCTPDERFVSVEQVKQALEAKRKMIIIDARPASDWRRVHIPGAVSIPYHDLKRLDEVPHDGTWVIAYCACPHHLSGDVVDALRRNGVKHAVVLDEGILEWHRRGYPVVAAPGVEPPLPAPGASPLGADAGKDGGKR